MTEEQVRALFHKARGGEYQAVVQGCREILSQLDRDLANHHSVAKLRGTLDGLNRELDRIQPIDYLDTPAGPPARKLWGTRATLVSASRARHPAGVPWYRFHHPAPGGEHPGGSGAARAGHGDL